jgi:uroporphyrinogen-III synthase
LLAGEFDALVLATAGLERLAHIADGNVRVMPIPMEHMLPAVAQGTLAVEAREDDAQVLALLKLIDHRDTHATLIAERAFLRAFDAGCQAPVAAHARIAGNRICLRGAVGLPDGSAFAQGERERPADQAEVVGATLAQRVLKAGGHTILNVMRDGTRPLSGWRIILTRASARGESLAVKLRALGATPVNLPVITHAPPVDPLALDGALLALCNGAYDWVAFTSVTAIEAVTARLDALACAWPAGARMAVVGEATAQMCEDALGRAPDCMPEHFDALSLARAMAAMHEFDRRRVLLPNADIAPATLQNALQALGMQVDRVTAYRTVCCDAPDSSSAMPANAIVFTSSSTVACFASQFAERRAIAVCIGRQTAHAAAGAGFERIVTAATATEDGLIDALLRIANEG